MSFMSPVEYTTNRESRGIMFLMKFTLYGSEITEIAFCTTTTDKWTPVYSKVPLVAIGGKFSFVTVELDIKDSLFTAVSKITI